MQLKTMVIASLSSILAVLFLFFLFGVSPSPIPIPVSVSALGRNAEFWVGRRVIVKGKLICGLLSIPEQRPPYNCLLKDLYTGKSVGVFLRGSDSGLDDKSVIVVGVVKKVYRCSMIVRPVYYIAAELVHATY